MLLGTSLSRCVRDIYDGKVEIDDIFVVVARTKFDPLNDNHWTDIWSGYLHSEWRGLDDYEQEVKSIVLELHHTGKLHQPRNFRGLPSKHVAVPRISWAWLELIVPYTDLSDSAKEAWDQFKFIQALEGK